MPVFLLPQFVADLQEHKDANFARRVLQKTLCVDGSFRADSDDHRYEGIADAWIRYVSRGRTAYRVIYLRVSENVYLFRAGEHAVEDRLTAANPDSMAAAVPVTEATSEVEDMIAAMPEGATGVAATPVIDRFRRNLPNPQINRQIFSRRNLPHRDIWLVAPFIDSDLFLPTAQFGKLLFAQLEDGASISIFTMPPKDNNIEWMEKLAERGISIFVFPRLHTKLYCFVFDDNRRYEHGLPSPEKLASLILIGSADLTAAGLALGEGLCNEELCYSVPEIEIGYVENYVTELMLRGYELPEVRSYLARGQWQKLENI